MYRAKIYIKPTICKKQHIPRSFCYIKLKKSGTVSAFRPNYWSNGTNFNETGTTNEYWSKLKECLRNSVASTVGHTSRKCISWQQKQSSNYVKCLTKHEYQEILTTGCFEGLQHSETEINHYWSDMALGMEMPARLGKTIPPSS